MREGVKRRMGTRCGIVLEQNLQEEVNIYVKKVIYIRL